MLFFLLYNLLVALFSPLIVLYIIWQLVVTDRSRGGTGERLGFIPRRKLPPGKRIWLHAVSVGETAAAKPIWEALLAALPGWELLHSTTTDTGQAQARKAVRDRGHTCYLPLDFLPCVWIALHRVRPNLIVVVETELWPNLFALARWYGCRVMVVNGRISDRSLRGAQHFGWVYRWMMSKVDHCCMQSECDAARIIQLGADPSRVTVVGNSKFDTAIAVLSEQEQAAMRASFGLTPAEPVLLAGCTHPGEEEIVLSAFARVKAQLASARLIIAPRDINRAAKVEEMAAAQGFTAIRRTKIAAVPLPPDAVIVLDTIGELSRAYALCSVAFVGGSLAPVGGHNVLEPLGMGKPALFGPHMSNFRDIAAITREKGVAFQIASAEELADCWLRLLGDPARCAAIAVESRLLFQQYTGASLRIAEKALKLLTSEEKLREGEAPAEPRV